MAPKTGQSGSSGGKAAMNSLSCVVPLCKANLLKESHISIKSGTCEAHRTAFSVTKGGVLMRFCQKCAKLQALDAFDGEKRACREKLDQHNARRRQQHKEKREQKLEQRNAKAENQIKLEADEDSKPNFYPREASNHQGQPAGANSDWRDVSEYASDITQGISSPPRRGRPDAAPWSFLGQQQGAPPKRPRGDGDVRRLGDNMSQNYDDTFSRMVHQGTGGQQMPPYQSAERLPRQPFYYEPHHPPPPAPFDPAEAQAYKRAVMAILQRGLADLEHIATDPEALWQIVGHVITDLKTERRHWDMAAELQERQMASAWALAAALGAGAGGHHPQHQPYNRHREGDQGSGGSNVASLSPPRHQHPSYLRRASSPVSSPGAARPQGPNLGVSHHSAYGHHPWAIAPRPGPEFARKPLGSSGSSPLAATPTGNLE